MKNPIKKNMLSFSELGELYEAVKDNDFFTFDMVNEAYKKITGEDIRTYKFEWCLNEIIYDMKTRLVCISIDDERLDLHKEIEKNRKLIVKDFDMADAHGRQKESCHAYLCINSEIGDRRHIYIYDDEWYYLERPKKFKSLDTNNFV